MRIYMQLNLNLKIYFNEWIIFYVTEKTIWYTLNIKINPTEPGIPEILLESIYVHSTSNQNNFSFILQLFIFLNFLK